MQYDFSEVINRKDTLCTKWDEVDSRLGVHGLLPLWIADMDFKSPKEVINAIKVRADHGIFGYVTEPDSYYEAIINWVKNRHNWQIEREWITHAPGVVAALSFAVLALTKPGDKIIIQPPIYYPFKKIIECNDRQVVYNPLIFNGEKYSLNYEDLEEKIDSKVKLLLLCNPHNPIGKVWTKEELQKIGEICLKHNVLVVSDEIHSDFIYQGYQHTSFASISNEFAQHSITCNSASKTFNLAGLQTSYIIIPNEELFKKYNNILNALSLLKHNLFGVVTLEAAYTYGGEWLKQMLDYLQGNLDFMIDFIAQRLPQIKVIKPEGTYLIWLDFRELGMEVMELKNFILTKAKVAMDDGYIFGPGGEGFERINIACPRRTLKEGLCRIEKAIKEL